MSPPKLVSAVAEAGGLGSFGAAPFGPQQIMDAIAEIRANTKHAFSVNLWVPPAAEHTKMITEAEYCACVDLLRPYFDEVGATAPPFDSLADRPTRFEDQVHAVIEARAPVVSFVFGIPNQEILSACHERGIITLGVAINVAEAVALEAAGVDFIIASSSEAGGLRASFLPHADDQLPMSAFLPQVTRRVDTPVIAAGGIADGRGIVAALAYGACGVQVGTAFVPCEESNASASFKQAVLSDRARSTCITRVFVGLAGRALKSRLSSELSGHEAEWLGYPHQFALTLPMRQAVAKSGITDLQPLWAGQNATLVQHRRVSDLMEFLVNDVNETISRLRGLAPSAGL
jgi:nitronate monooxygenase